MGYNCRVARRPPDPTVWAQRLVGRMSPADVERINRALLVSIDEVSGKRWEAAKVRAGELPGDLRPEKIAALTTSMSRELAAFGAAAGAVAVTPMVGTGLTVMTAMAELGWFTMRAGDLILTIAALHGRPEPTVDERRAWVLAVLLFGGSARDGMARAINQAGTGLAPTTTSRLPISTLQQANRILTRMVLRRYGTRRAAIALGTALPLGLGAAFGGSANYLAVKALAKHADQFFSRLPYSAVDAHAVEVGGALSPPRPISPPSAP
jgi:hypothetical protein